MKVAVVLTGFLAGASIPVLSPVGLLRFPSESLAEKVMPGSSVAEGRRGGLTAYLTRAVMGREQQVPVLGVFS